MNTHANRLAPRPVPLFASSWVALFAMIRHGLTQRAETVDPESRPARD